MRRLCISDIHGCYTKLNEVLEVCKFSDADELYSVGDFCDRGTENLKTLDFIMSLKNFRPVIGNHDWWLYLWLWYELKKDSEGFFLSEDEWESINCWTNWNGGVNTYAELVNLDQDRKAQIYDWLLNIPFRRNLGDRIIQHSMLPAQLLESRGQNLTIPIDEIVLGNIRRSGLMWDIVYDSNLWDRTVIKGCKDYTPIGQKIPSFSLWHKERYEKEFTGSPIYVIGHTPLSKPFYDKDLGIIGIDTGGFCTKQKYGVIGCLTVLDLDTLEYWQSGSQETFRFTED